MVLGARVWTRSHKFRLVLGPLRALQFEQMLPDSAAVGTVFDLVRTYTNDEWDCELVLLLTEASSEPMRLGAGARLGWTTRVGSGKSVDVELVIDPRRRRTQRFTRTGTRRLSREDGE
jgi:type VI secretion system protein ImpH